MKYLFSLLLCLFYFAPLLEATCYLSLDANQQKSSSLSTQALALLSRYVAPVEPMPPSGVPLGSCIYQASLTQAEGQSLFSLKGPRINGFGVSTQKGQRGQSQALLYALYLGKADVSFRSRICADYPKELQSFCRPLSVELLFFDEFGRPLPDGTTVRSGESFFLLLRPLTPLYAQIFNRDAAGELYQIFPNKEVNPQSNPLTPGESYFFPQKKGDLIFRFDQKQGEEHFFLVFSAAPLHDLDIAFAKLQQKKTRAGQKVFTALLNQRGAASTQQIGKVEEIAYRQQFTAMPTRFQGQGTFVVHWSLVHR